MVEGSHRVDSSVPMKTAAILSRPSRPVWIARSSKVRWKDYACPVHEAALATTLHNLANSMAAKLCSPNCTAGSCSKGEERVNAVLTLYGWCKASETQRSIQQRIDGVFPAELASVRQGAAGA